MGLGDECLNFIDFALSPSISSNSIDPRGVLFRLSMHHLSALTISRLFKLTLAALLLGGFCASDVQAQQDPQFTHFVFQPTLYNPAAAGSERGLDFTALGRVQWAGLTGAPQTQSLTAHLPLYGLNAGAGVVVLNDIAGSQRTTSVYAQFAYRLELSKTATLGIGVSGGIIQQSLDGTELLAPEGNYEGGTINHNDDFIPVGLVSGVSPDLGAGIWLEAGGLNLGVSSTHLLEPTVTYDLGGGSSSIRFNRNLHVTAAYQFKVGETVSLRPIAGYKTDLNLSMADLGAMIFVQDNIWAGVSFRTWLSERTDAVSGLVGARITPRFGVGYSYDYTLSTLNTVSSGTHEVMLKYLIAIEKPRSGKRINNLRYLHY